MNRVISDETIPDQDDINNCDVIDGYVNIYLALSRGDEDRLQHAIVKKCAVDCDSLPIGVANSNQVLDSCVYEVEYNDGSLEALSTNIIAENVLSQVDENGHRQMMTEEIIYHRRTSDAMAKNDSTDMPHKLERLKVGRFGYYGQIRHSTRFLSKI